jgi:hypothetical protein
MGYYPFLKRSPAFLTDAVFDSIERLVSPSTGETTF